MEKVLLFYSGGNDSTLSACNLAFEGYEVNLVTFDNGCEKGLNNLKNRVHILEELFKDSSYGRIKNLGIFNIIGSFINFKYLCANTPFSEIIKEYGDLNINQLNCLSCRSAMYAVGIKIANELGIKYIAEGARKTQHFALEQKIILDEYEKIANEYGIKILFPVHEYNSDKEVENKLLKISTDIFSRIYSDTTSYEPCCLLGMPMNRDLTKEELEGYKKYFINNLKPAIKEEINIYPEYIIKEYIKKPNYNSINLK